MKKKMNPKDFNKREKIKAALRFTADIYGKDLLKTKLKDNTDAIEILNSTQEQYNRFVENGIREALKANGFEFLDHEAMIDFLTTRCEIRRDESVISKYGNQNPINFLYTDFRTANETLICSWNDTPETIDNLGMQQKPEDYKIDEMLLFKGGKR
jgi:hypothetical protein